MSAHTPISERRRLVAQWRHSSHALSMSAFARSVGVPQSTFARWTRELTEDPPTPTFVELTSNERPTTAPPRLSLQLEVADEVDLHLLFNAQPTRAWLGKVLRGVFSC